LGGPDALNVPAFGRERVYVTINYKYQPFTADADYDLTAISPQTYTIIGFATVPTPVLSPPPGAFVTSIVISCSAAPAGFTAYYTLDGTPVDNFSTPWPGGGAGTITLTASTLVRVKFIALSGQRSDELSAQYTLATVAPTAQCSAPAWSFSGTLNVTSGNITLTATTAGSSISYSKNGGATQTYASPVSLACTTSGDTIEFWATKAGLLDSVHVTIDNTKSRDYGGGGDRGGGGHYPP